MIVTLSFVWLVHLFLNSFRLSLTIVATGLILLALISAIKYHVLQIPLTPGDFLLSGQGTTVFSSDMWPMSVVSTLLSAIAVIGLFTLIWLKAPRWKMHIGRRVSYFLAGTAVLYYCITPKSFPDLIEEVAKVALRPIKPPHHAPNSEQNGFLVGFLNHGSMLVSSMMNRPDDYQSNQIDRLIIDTERNRSTTPPPNRTEFEAPNLIIVVNESFYDITKTPGLELSADPLETFHRHSKENVLLNVVSPSYGGRTCNAEFELLTGGDIGMLSNPSAHPFIKPLNRWPSLVSNLKDRGYRTLAMHPNSPDFWNRSVAFPALGFEEFVSENELTSYGPERYKGGGLSDVAMIEETIKRIKSFEQPYFCYTLTIENHLSYIKPKYQTFSEEERPVKVIKPEITDTDQRNELQHYIDGLVMADRSLGKLLKYLEQEETRPTLLVFLGDHRPSLRRNVPWMYKKSKDKKVQMHTVPVLIWANYPISQDETMKQTCDMSAMPGYILRQLGYELPPQLLVARRFHRQYPIYSPNFIRDRAGKSISADEIAKAKVFQDYRMMQYDIFFGKQFALKRNEIIMCGRPTGSSVIK